MVKTVKPKNQAAAPEKFSATVGQPLRAAESRLDLLTGQWSVFAPNRDARPEEYVPSGETINRALQCPFCCGHEGSTPAPVWIGRIDDGVCQTDVTDGSQADWSVRVVPNLYPAVDATPKPIESQAGSPLFQRASAYGGHEVIIESPQHVASMSRLDLAEVQLTFLAYRDRLRHWRKCPGISYLTIFKNVGEKAGASLRHSHSQLIATDRLPMSVETSVKRMSRHRAETGCCLQCDLVRAELKAEHRVVWQDGKLIAFCPFASRLPMLMRITTQQHQSCFEQLDEATIESVSRIVYRAIAWLEKLRPRTAYNLCLSTQPPAADDSSDAFHWSIDLFPRMTQIAGFEWSSGCMINPVLPETAAADYRRMAKAEDPRAAL